VATPGHLPLRGNPTLDRSGDAWSPPAAREPALAAQARIDCHLQDSTLRVERDAGVATTGEAVAPSGGAIRQ
jgi:hypothetical protein